MRNPVGVGIIVLTLLVAAALRLWGLPGIPPGPHYDEAANGVLSAEIALHEKAPIFIPSYTGKEVLFFYGAAAGMRLLGPVVSLSNHADLLALRLASALFGLLTVVAAAWLTYELFADDDPDGAPWLAALTAALVATSFWHVLLSRVGFRAITQPLLQTLTLAALCGTCASVLNSSQGCAGCCCLCKGRRWVIMIGGTADDASRGRGVNSM
jgi:4-amino-4-deoxy-L-arabinose transferase-like glycosyltransferase